MEWEKACPATYLTATTPGASPDLAEGKIPKSTVILPDTRWSHRSPWLGTAHCSQSSLGGQSLSNEKWWCYFWMTLVLSCCSWESLNIETLSVTAHCKAGPVHLDFSLSAGVNPSSPVTVYHWFIPAENPALYFQLRCMKTGGDLSCSSYREVKGSQRVLEK